MTDQLFTDADVVSVYTTEQAVEDGVLVPIGRGHIATRAVWEWLSAIELDRPPNDVVIDLLTWIRGEHALAILRGLTTYEIEATRVYEQNIGGGVYTTELLGRTLWLIPNGAGITILFPEDY